MAALPSESAQTDRRTADSARAGVKPPDVPAPPLSVVEREAVNFLANVYKVAAAKNAARFLPAWMGKYRERSKIVHAAGREPQEFLPDEATTSDVTTAQRRNVLRIVASQSGRSNEPTASTADVLRLVDSYERAHDVGMQAIERLAKNWMLATLRQHAQGQAQFLIQAKSQRNTLQWAAMYIEVG